VTLAILDEVTMWDEISVRDLLLRGVIGITADERRDRQDILINFTLFCETFSAAATDDILDTVNYRTITKRIIALVEGGTFQLVERLADEIAKICLEDPRVAQVRVSVEKPGALRFARSVGVTITRTQ
jgi:FolB domain-containing protein